MFKDFSADNANHAMSIAELLTMNGNCVLGNKNNEIYFIGSFYMSNLLNSTSI